jgi:hypothetical protein
MERERGVVADRADVAEVIGEPLELSHQRPQMACPWRRFDGERRLDGVGERDRIGDSAVAGGPRGKPRRLVDGRAAHQRLDALVYVAEPLFEPNHGLAAGGKAEMARLDDAGVHRAHRNLMQAFAFDRQKRIG